MIDRKELTRLVKEALRNLYDPVHLQGHPLVVLLCPDHEVGETSGEALRRLMRETVERLRPSGGPEAECSEMLGYEVLRLHYLRSLSQDDVLKELNISASTFFRRQREALDAVVSLLWERCRDSAMEERAVASFTSSEQALNHAASLVSRGPGDVVDLSALLNDIIQTTAPLADQHEVVIQAEVIGSPSVVYDQLPILRQILLSLIIGSLRQASRQVLRVTAVVRQDEIIWSLEPLRMTRIEDLWDQEALEVACRRLVDLCSARLESESEGSDYTAVVLAVPMPNMRIVLVVDDDPDAIALYRRLLQLYNATLLGARSAEQANTFLSQATPDLVLLDVILPGEDGWSLLRRLKSSPKTANVPVVVCSVIEQPELALALGAADVINKPILPADLMRAVERLL